MTSVSSGHVILTPAQPVNRGTEKLEWQTLMILYTMNDFIFKGLVSVYEIVFFLSFVRALS